MHKMDGFHIFSLKCDSGMLVSSNIHVIYMVPKYTKNIWLMGRRQKIQNTIALISQEHRA